MKNLYSTCAGKLCLALIATLLFVYSSQAQKMVTYDTTFSGWNAIVTEDVALQGTDSAAGIVFFPGIGEMTTNIADLSKNGPHYLINSGIWDGSVSLGNGVHHPFIISLQPPTSGYPASSVKPMIDAILKRYRIKRNSFYMTGLSMGGWQANEFVCYEPTAGDDTYGRLVKALVILEGVEPADYTSPYNSKQYPQKMGHWAKACGGRELWVEGSNDWRDMLAGAQNMTDSVPKSATYFMVTYGGGAHCCWNSEYDPSTTWTMPANSNISQLVGTPQAMNVWQWLLRQGDTSMPAGETGLGTAPTVSAGSAQTVTLPTSSATLKGVAKAGSKSSVGSTSWTQVSGPNTAGLGSLVNSLLNTVTGLLNTVLGGSDTVSAKVSGLVAGTYVFQLTAKDNDGQAASSTVTVVVNSSSAATPPTVTAGSGQTVTLPTSSATLTGTAAGNGGATITGLSWKESSGPATAKFGTPSSLSTTVTGMTAAGSYVFTLTATDSKSSTASATVTVTVKPVATAVKIAPTVSAGASQTITLPTSQAALSGTATGNGGATISGYNWMLMSGPGYVKFSNEWAASTAVTGLVAGTYQFALQATDNNGTTTTSSAVSVVVKKAGTTAMTSGVVTGSGLAIGDSTGSADHAAGLTVFPNPARGVLNVRLDNEVTGKVVLAVFNARGARVQSLEVGKDQVHLEVSVDVSRLVAGVYVIEIVSGPKVLAVEKFIKQ